jgi:hypothetical protein
MRDFKRLMQDPPAGISGAPQDSNILLWNAVIFGYDAEPCLSPSLEQLQQFGKPTWHPYNFGKIRKIGLQQFGKPTCQK